MQLANTVDGKTFEFTPMKHHVELFLAKAR